MAFFDADGPDGYFPIGDIARLERGWYSKLKDEDHPSVVYMKDGRKIHVEQSTIDAILGSAMQLIAAAPGYRLLSYIYQPGESNPGPWITEEPVIAWRASIYGGIDPVVIDPEFRRMTGIHAIREPTGAVYTLEASYRDQEAWADDVKATLETEAARKISATRDGQVH